MPSRHDPQSSITQDHQEEPPTDCLDHYTHMQLVAGRLHVDEEANHDTGQANPFEHR